MAKPRSAKYHGRVDGEIMDISMLEIDCPLVGMEVTISASGKVMVKVDGQPVLEVRNGALLRVEDMRTGYVHEAATE